MKNYWFDVVNGLFELGGAIATWFNVRRIRRDKTVRGVDWRSMAFFATWGLWSIVLYNVLDQMLFSLLGAIALTSGNLTWVAMYFVYRNRE